MNKTEAAQILAVLRAAYPTFYSRMTQADVDATVALWAEMFADDAAADVAKAVKVMIAGRVNNFPPNIGEVKDYLYRITAPRQRTSQEAWAIVSKAAADCDLQFPTRTFDRLPEDIQRAIGSPQMLKEWALANTEQFSTVIASNFQRSYRAIQQRDIEDAKLPASLRIAGPATGLKRLGGHDDG